MEQNDNKYAPPIARVADPALEALVIKPRQAVLAIRLLWVSTMIGIFYNTFLEVTMETSTAYKNPSRVIIGLTITVLFYIWFINRISVGKNWARILMLIVIMLTLLLSALQFINADLYAKMYPQLLDATTLTVIISWSCFALQVAALWLLFTKPGSEWFKTKST